MMAVTLTPIFADRRLAVTGDIHANLAIPAAPPREVGGAMRTEVYYIAFSDGSMVLASFSEEPEYVVLVEGAGLITMRPDGSLVLDWNLEWVSLASNLEATAFTPKEPAYLPLLEAMLEPQRKTA